MNQNRQSAARVADFTEEDRTRIIVALHSETSAADEKILEALRGAGGGDLSGYPSTLLSESTSAPREPRIRRNVPIREVGR